jgi:hypothetical protein
VGKSRRAFSLEILDSYLVASKAFFSVRIFLIRRYFETSLNGVAVDFLEFHLHNQAQIRAL